MATAALAGTLLLGACGQADTAATVNGDRISEDATLTTATQINEAFSETLQQPLTTDQVLSQLITARFVNEVADAAGVGTPESRARSAMPDLEPTDDTILLVRANLSLQALDEGQQAEVLQDLRDATISVNPRYGRFDIASVALTPGTPNWIVEGSGDEEPEPDATPGG